MRLLLVCACLPGALSGSLLPGRRRGVDIRTRGSGDAGGSNAFRTQGPKFAAVTVMFDILARRQRGSASRFERARRRHRLWRTRG